MQNNMHYILPILILIGVVVLIHDAYIIMSWPKCPKCNTKADAKDDMWWCPKCQYYL